jgi:hypothetical protein
VLFIFPQDERLIEKHLFALSGSNLMLVPNFAGIPGIPLKALAFCNYVPPPPRLKL